MSRQCRCWVFVVAASLVTGSVQGQVRLGPKGPQTVPTPAKNTSKSQPRRPPHDPNKPETFKLSVSPASEPHPALKYALLPKYGDITPGNSVPFYYRAILATQSMPKKALKRFWDNYDRWMEGPPEKMPKQEVRQFLKSFNTIFDELKVATHRESTDWSWRMRRIRGLKAISFLLPEIQESRQVARLLVLRIRLAIAERRYDDAIASFQMGYKLARDVAEPPTLINDLVGVAIAQILNSELRNMIASPGAPNMYWALSKMQRPFIDLEPAMQYEMSLPAKLFPSMLEAETADHSPEEWGRILGKAFLSLRGTETGRIAKERAVQAQLAVTGLALQAYPRIKRELIAAGYDRKRVEAMPVGQAIAIHQARTYQYMYQEMMKWSHLPYHVAAPYARKTEARLKREGYFAPAGRSRELIPLAGMLLPAVWQAHSASARLDARLSGLQTLEAIRMYAADHGGQMPDTLADIRKVPVPNNPLTGQPFPYHKSADTAVLEMPAPARLPANIGWRLEITVAK